MKLTPRQQQILVGSILGDGGVYKPQKSSNAYYYLKQSARYAEYVQWLFDELKNLCPSSVKQRKDNGQFYFYTSPHEDLSRFQKKFYKNRIKIVPNDIDGLLKSPLTLAVWFMDDGTLDYRFKDHCAFHLCTNCFTRDDAKKLIKALNDNFGIVSTLHYTLCRGKRHSRIYIGSKGRDKFINLVSPFVLNCFKYKLPQFRHPSETQPHGLDGTAMKLI